MTIPKSASVAGAAAVKAAGAETTALETTADTPAPAAVEPATDMAAPTAVERAADLPAEAAVEPAGLPESTSAESGAPIPEAGATEAERPMRADARRNRERILQAAREVFGEDGAGAQMDDVAQRAGVGVGTVYRHFPTKEALMGELVRQKFALFVVLARDALAADAEPFEVLTDLMRLNAEHVARDAATRYAMGEGTAVWDAANVERDELSGLLAELIGRGHRAGTLRADIKVADIPMLMCGISTSIDRGFDWRRHLGLVVDGMRAATPGRIRSL